MAHSTRMGLGATPMLICVALLSLSLLPRSAAIHPDLIAHGGGRALTAVAACTLWGCQPQELAVVVP